MSAVQECPGTERTINDQKEHILHTENTFSHSIQRKHPLYAENIVCARGQTLNDRADRVITVPTVTFSCGNKKNRGLSLSPMLELVHKVTFPIL